MVYLIYSSAEDLASLNLLTDSSACWSTIDDLGNQPSALAPLMSGENTTFTMHSAQNSSSSSPNSISARNQKIDENTLNLELQVSQESYDDRLPWSNSYSTEKKVFGTSSITRDEEVATNEYSPAALSSPEPERFKEAPSLSQPDQVPLNGGGATAHHSESQDSARTPTLIGPRASWNSGGDVATSPTSKERTDLPLNVLAAPYDKQESRELLIISPVQKELSGNATALPITMQAQTHNGVQGTTISLVTPTELTTKPLQSVSNLGESQLHDIAKNSDQLDNANTFTPIITRLVSKDRNERVAREDEAITNIPSRYHPALSESNTSRPAESITQSPPRDIKSSSVEKPPGQQQVLFGGYILGQTVGKEDGVEVKLARHCNSGIEVAIRIYRREPKSSDSQRWPRICREVAIQRKLRHPGIQLLHEMMETEKHIGLVLEYPTGGALFHYVLNHRHLQDNLAQRLFAQLVSAIGYLHKLGVVHRNLNLETVCLDQNRNVIVTNFYFASTFNPDDRLGEEVGYNLGDGGFMVKMNLARVDRNGYRRGDLMQTSCGSPCYSPPEVFVSRHLYTGRKVDVWSCGVVLVSPLRRGSSISLILGLIVV